MFENYVGAKTKPLRPWVIPLFFGAVALVAMAVMGLIAYQLLAVSLLEPPDTELAMAAPPPPPPPPPPGSKSKPQHTPKKKVHKVKDTVQPDRDRKPPEEVVEEDSESEGIEGGVLGGVEGGVVGGVVGGTLGGVVGGSGNAPPPPPVEAKIVPPHALEAQRVAGDAHIVPSDTDKIAIKRQGKAMVISVVKMCLTAGGSVKSIQMLKSSGFPGYDRKIKSKMRQWKYRPFRVNGKAVPVCTSVTFQYRQSN
ncbi:MAG TPA: TonB family protein [Kofleriaceae bacterium]|nr:TonB family protein [Kofleriaceae bacterium]